MSRTSVLMLLLGLGLLPFVTPTAQKAKAHPHGQLASLLKDCRISTYLQTTYKRLYYGGRWTYCYGSVKRRRCHGVCNALLNKNGGRFGDLLRRGNVGHSHNPFPFLRTSKHKDGFGSTSGGSCCHATRDVWIYSQQVTFRCGTYAKRGYVKDFVVTREPAACVCAPCGSQTVYQWGRNP